MLSPFQSTFDPKQSHNNKNNYDKIQNTARFANHKKDYRAFLDSFMTSEFFCDNAGLGFTDYNPKEKDINSMTQTVFYDTEFMRRQQFRMEYEFEKECLNQMARTCLSKYGAKVDGTLESSNKYKVCVKIGFGHTYSKCKWKAECTLGRTLLPHFIVLDTSILNH